MDFDTLSLLERIEESRKLMHEFSMNKDLTDPEVISVSQKLDRLLNEYYLAIRTYQFEQIA